MPSINLGSGGVVPPDLEGHKTVDIHGKRYTEEEINQILKHLTAQGVIIPAQSPRPEVVDIARNCGALVLSVDQQDAQAIIANVGQVLSSVTRACNLVPQVNARTEGAPPRDGSVEAARTTADVLTGHQAAQQMTQVEPAHLRSSAWQCQVAFGLDNTLQMTQQHLINFAAPKSRKMVEDVRTVAKTIKPQVEVTLSLALRMDSVYTYLQEPYDRAVLNRRKGEERDVDTARRTEELVGAKARTDARADAEGVVRDVVRAYFLKDK